MFFDVHYGDALAMKDYFEEIYYGLATKVIETGIIKGLGSLAVLR